MADPRFNGKEITAVIVVCKILRKYDIHMLFMSTPITCVTTMQYAW